MSKKLLLADDSITIRKVVGIIFANEDYSLTLVDNGTEALEKAGEIKPDVILADVQMPGRNGYEVCADIRRNPELGDIPVLLLTGAFEPFDEEKAKECGADDFISKPFESQLLLEKVNKLYELGNERKTAETIVAPEPEPEPVPPKLEPVEPVPVIPVEPPPVMPVEEVPAAVATTHEAFGDEAFLLEEVSCSDEIIEALPEDDPWGSFNADSAQAKKPAATEGEFAELENMDLRSLGVETSQPSGTIPSDWQPAEEETFTLGDDTIETAMEPETEEELFTLAPEEEFSGVGQSQEDVFTLGEESIQEPGLAAAATTVAEALSQPSDSDLQFAPEEEYVPVTPLEVVAPEAQIAAETAVEIVPAASGEVALSEEQLATALSKVSRDVIEKIVWEVVPDLAEMLIREEIRKIKKGIQD